MKLESGDKEVQVKLSDAFKLAAAEVQDKEVAAMMGGMEGEGNTLPGGLISVYGNTPSKEFHSIRKKREKAFWDFIFRETLKRALEKLQAIIGFHQEQMERLMRQIKEARELLVILDKNYIELRKEMKRYQEEGAFKLDDNGAFQNNRVESIICEWERKTGKSIGRPITYGETLKILVDVEVQQQELSANIESNLATYEHHKSKRDEALQIREDLQSGDTQRRRSALERIENLGRDNGKDLDLATSSETAEEGTDELSTSLEISLEEDKYDGFSFGFPPLQDEFKKAVAGEIEKVANPGSEQPSLQKKTADFKTGR